MPEVEVVRFVPVAKSFWETRGEKSSCGRVWFEFVDAAREFKEIVANTGERKHPEIDRKESRSITGCGKVERVAMVGIESAQRVPYKSRSVLY